MKLVGAIAVDTSVRRSSTRCFSPRRARVVDVLFDTPVRALAHHTPDHVYDLGGSRGRRNVRGRCRVAPYATLRTDRGARRPRESIGIERLRSDLPDDETQAS